MTACGADEKGWTCDTDIVGKFQVTLVPGDGIGNELADSVKAVFDAIKVPITFDEVDVKGETEGKDEKFLEAMDSLTRNKVGLKGIIYTPPDSTGHNSWNVRLYYFQCGSDRRRRKREKS
jgi:isocitrate dehydrogenase (NAD+)